MTNSNTNSNQVLSFSASHELFKWFEVHHAKKSELWIKVYKKGSGIQSVSWDDIVTESLCWGWIDGIKKSIDDIAYLQRITPRKAKSSWSKRNRDHVERLLEQNRMKLPGLNQVTAAKEDGRWDAAYRVSEMTVPDDFTQVLELHPEAKQFYSTLTKSHRYIIANGLLSAKKAETRKKRFDKYLTSLIKQLKPS